MKWDDIVKLVMWCVVIVICAFEAGVGHAQERAAWTDEGRVAALINNNAAKFAADVVEELSPEAVARLEAKWFPAPTDAEKRAALERAALALRDAGLDDKAAAMIEIVKVIDALPVADLVVGGGDMIVEGDLTEVER